MGLECYFRFEAALVTMKHFLEYGRLLHEKQRSLPRELLIERERLLIIMVWINKWSWQNGVDITQSKTTQKVTSLTDVSFVSKEDYAGIPIRLAPNYQLSGVKFSSIHLFRSRFLRIHALFVSLATLIFISEPRFCEEVETSKEQMFQNTIITRVAKGNGGRGMERDSRLSLTHEFLPGLFNRPLVAGVTWPHLPRKFLYLTIIHRRRGEYCRIIPETKSRGLFDNIHRVQTNCC